MTPPSIAAEICVLVPPPAADFTRRGAADSAMHAFEIVVVAEQGGACAGGRRSSRTASGRGAPSNRADEALDEGMRDGSVRDGLDLLDIEDA